MTPPYRCLMIGAGGMAGRWAREFWTPFRDRMTIVGLVDINPVALQTTGDWLGLPENARFTSTREAFESVDADFCCIATPPAFHREAVELACARRMHILSEKPVADTVEACAAIVRYVRDSRVKMMITQNYRYTPRILTLKAAVAELGGVNYVVARYASDYRVRGAWGAAFRHTMPHSLLIEGGIHHFDQIRNLSGGNCLTIAGWDWNPGLVHAQGDNWRGGDSFDGEPCGLFVMRMNNGSFASYEGNNLASGKTHSWRSEYYRVECDGGAAVLDRDHTVRIEDRSDGGTLQIREVAPVPVTWEGHLAMPAQFLDWLDGGPAPPTTLEDNLQSTAMLFASIRASESGDSVDVQEVVSELTGAA
jgi:predicted dehydrogenase